MKDGLLKKTRAGWRVPVKATLFRPKLGGVQSLKMKRTTRVSFVKWKEKEKKGVTPISPALQTKSASIH